MPPPRSNVGCAASTRPAFSTGTRCRSSPACLRPLRRLRRCAPCRSLPACPPDSPRTDRSRAMSPTMMDVQRYIAEAELAASQIPDVPDNTQARNVAQVGVIGAGTMGGGIAMNFASAGIPVVLLEMKQEALDKGLATIRRNYENSAKKGKLTTEQVEQRMASIAPTLGYDALRDVDL